MKLLKKTVGDLISFDKFFAYSKNLQNKFCDKKYYFVKLSKYIANILLFNNLQTLLSYYYYYDYTYFLNYKKYLEENMNFFS